MNKIEREEIKELKDKYYSLKKRVIDEILENYCIIPKNALLNLRENYKSDFADLLRVYGEEKAREKTHEKYGSIVQKYCITQASKMSVEESQKEVKDLESFLGIYESVFESSKTKEGLLRLIGKTTAGKMITVAQIVSILIGALNPSEIGKNLAEVVLMQLTKYGLENNLYKKSPMKASDEMKISALKDGIDYLEKYFEKKGLVCFV